MKNGSLFHENLVVIGHMIIISHPEISIFLRVYHG